MKTCNLVFSVKINATFLNMDRLQLEYCFCENRQTFFQHVQLNDNVFHFMLSPLNDSERANLIFAVTRQLASPLDRAFLIFFCNPFIVFQVGPKTFL